MAKFVSGFIGGGAVSSLLLFVFKGQNKKISDLDKKKTDKDLCKTIHHNIDKVHLEIKRDVADIKIHMSEESIRSAKMETHLEGIKKALENNGR